MRCRLASTSSLKSLSSEPANRRERASQDVSLHHLLHICTPNGYTLILRMLFSTWQCSPQALLIEFDHSAKMKPEQISEGPNFRAMYSLTYCASDLLTISRIVLLPSCSSNFLAASLVTFSAALVHPVSFQLNVRQRHFTLRPRAHNAFKAPWTSFLLVTKLRRARANTPEVW